MTVCKPTTPRTSFDDLPKSSYSTNGYLAGFLGLAAVVLWASPSFGQSARLMMPSLLTGMTVNSDFSQTSSFSGLPRQQLNDALSFDSSEFQELKGQYLTKPFDDAQLLTFGKGLVTTSTSQPDTLKGLEIVEQLAEKGSPEANLALALWSTTPTLRPLLGNSNSFLLTAAQNGSTLAEQAYGRSLILPTSAAYNPSQGITWLQESVDAGNVAANADLARAYEFGLGVKQDIQRSDQLLKAAAATSEPSLAREYADFKLRNGATETDPDVIALMKRAAGLGDVPSQLYLADQSLKPGSTLDEVNGATRTLGSLALGGNISAMIRLGSFYSEPPAGTKADLQQAETWFQAAAKTGDLDAQAQLGEFYLDKFGKDSDKGLLGQQLLSAAAAGGNEPATVALDQLKLASSPDPIATYSQALAASELSNGRSDPGFRKVQLASCDSNSATHCEPVPVFYFTNRKPDLQPNGDVTLENMLAPGRAVSFGMSLAYAPTKSTVAASPPQNLWDVAVHAAEALPFINNFFQQNSLPNQDFSLQNGQFQGDAKAFISQMHQFAKAAGKSKILVYVHGFANSFEDAADRMALISQQYNYPGIPVLLDWASADVVGAEASADRVEVGYINDSEVERNSCSAFQQILEELAAEFGGNNVIVLSHSMGGQLVSDMLTSCEGGAAWDNKDMLGPVIFAAPDVDSKAFATESGVFTTHAKFTALYTSTDDEALAISAEFEADPQSRRAGQGGAGLLVIPHVQTIDATQVENQPGGDPNNHGYVFAARQVREDMVEIIRDTPLDKRDCITDQNGHRDPPGTTVGANPSEYWIIAADCQ